MQLQLLRRSVRTTKDVTGFSFGQECCDDAKDKTGRGENVAKRDHVAADSTHTTIDNAHDEHAAIRKQRNCRHCFECLNSAMHHLPI